MDGGLHHARVAHASHVHQGLRQRVAHPRALPAESQRELLTVIDEESDRLNRLVAEAVEMTQLDSQEVKMNFTPQSLDGMIATAMEENAAALATPPVDVRLPESLPRVMADPVWIQKLIGNLLENGAKYSNAGQPIFVSAEVRGTMVACSVADRGYGIDPLEQSLIFDKFLSVAPSPAGQLRHRNGAGHLPGDCRSPRRRHLRHEPGRPGICLHVYAPDCVDLSRRAHANGRSPQGLESSLHRRQQAMQSGPID